MSMRMKLLSLTAALAAVSACAKTSYCDVSVVVNLNAALDVDESCLPAINSCHVTVSGAESGSFTLGDNQCFHPTTVEIAQFSHPTDAEHGNVWFHVEIRDDASRMLGEGEGGCPFEVGGRWPVTVPIAPDRTAFMATGLCPPP